MSVFGYRAMALPKQHIVQWVQVKDISTVKDFTCKICRKTLQSAEECGFHMQIVAAAAKWIMRVGVTDCNKHLQPLHQRHIPSNRDRLILTKSYH